MTALVWFRDDLRVADNPALTAACESGGDVVALYVLDEVDTKPLGGASRWWLHHSLTSLAQDLKELGVPLILRRGSARSIVPEVVKATNATQLHWNRRYFPAGVSADRDLKAQLNEAGIEVHSHHANVLFEPHATLNAQGQPYKVFTPFWKSRLAALEPRHPLPVPASRPATGSSSALSAATEELDSWDLLPTRPDWAAGFSDWKPGEAGALERLEAFLEDGIDVYDGQRDFPYANATSRLSPHLRFGEVSPFTIWHRALEEVGAQQARKFLSEVGWREFSYHLIFHFPRIERENFQEKFAGLAWNDHTAADHAELLRAWRTGTTGVPLVDAGMRELWATGYMHNRVRMVVGSFLTKNLGFNWTVGEEWFWDTLLDADWANNVAGWQWIAGTGADAAPYFRVFNPILQSRKFDPDGLYIRRWVPELAGLDGKLVHEPWGLVPDYPAGPVVDLKASRAAALERYGA